MTTLSQPPRWPFHGFKSLGPALNAKHVAARRYHARRGLGVVVRGWWREAIDDDFLPLVYEVEG